MSTYMRPLCYQQSSRQRQRGSALLTALIFALLIGVAAVSYLKLAASEYRSSVRASLYASSLNLAETGVEMGVEALAAQQTSGSTWKKTVSNYLQDGGFVGDVALVIFDANTANPVIYADGVVRGHPAGDVRKQVRVELSTGFSPYARGFATRNGIQFNGSGVLFDSYNSKYGAYGDNLGISAPLGYGVAGRNKNDDIFVASDRIGAVGGTAVDQGNAHVYGYVAVSPTSTVSIGPNGVVTSYADGAHDASRVHGDFYADFPFEAHPSGTYDGTHNSVSGPTLIVGSTSAENPKYFDVSSISLSGNGSTLNIVGHVVLVMSGDISVTGQGGINITPTSSLQIYTASDVDIGGNGVVNADGVPSSFSIYGTATNGTTSGGSLVAGQTIKVSGNGQLAAAIYAPAADLTLNGGGRSGSVMGGVVAFTATVTGGSSFHFDEALREEIRGDGIYTIESWLEMTSATAASTPRDLSQY